MLKGLMSFVVVAAAVGSASAESIKGAGSIKGEYLEARNADVWTGPCFANAEVDIVGNKAIMAWKVSEGSYRDVKLDGLSIAAVVFAKGTFGMSKDPVPSKALLLVDQRASGDQKEALIAMAKELGRENIQEVIGVESVSIAMETCGCKEGGCASLDAGGAKIKTRCMHARDTICGHETLYYPPLAKVNDAHAAYSLVNRYEGKAFGEKYVDDNARSAVIGTFAL